MFVFLRIISMNKILKSTETRSDEIFQTLSNIDCNQNIHTEVRTKFRPLENSKIKNPRKLRISEAQMKLVVKSINEYTICTYINYKSNCFLENIQSRRFLCRKFGIYFCKQTIFNLNQFQNLI